MQTQYSKVNVHCAVRLTPPPLLSLLLMNRLSEDAVTKLHVYHMGAVGIFICKLLMQFYFLDYA